MFFYRCRCLYFLFGLFILFTFLLCLFRFWRSFYLLRFRILVLCCYILFWLLYRFWLWCCLWFLLRFLGFRWKPVFYNLFRFFINGNNIPLFFCRLVFRRCWIPDFLNIRNLNWSFFFCNIVLYSFLLRCFAACFPD